MDEQIGTFCAFTSATPQQAQQYLALTDGNVEQAVELFFNDPNLGATAPSPAPAAATTGQDQHGPITINDDDDEMDFGDDDVPRAGASAAQSGQPSLESDEAMAKRLQEEMYGGGSGGGGGAAGADVDEEGVRAPMARRTETLAGPDADWRDDPNQMRAAIAEQMAARQGLAQRRAQPGIFNQRSAASIWNEDDPNDPDRHRQVLSRATGGASDQTSKSNLLADLFRPPFDIIANLDWSSARDEGKENEKWIMVNVQDPSIFDCQVLNRDIWKNPSIKETIQEHFIFMQFNKADAQGQEYVQYYFANQADNEDAYPHIAIVDPRTGEQVKSWSGSPAPKASDFLMDLHEFLDRYSLSFDQKNPVQAKRKEKKKDVAQMSEEEMLEMAMQNSMSAGGLIPNDEDPDALTKTNRQASNAGGRASVPEIVDTTDMGPVASNGGATGPSSGSLITPNKEDDDDSSFGAISASKPHTEPDATVPAGETTRIQFRYSGGRVVRKFLLSDSVRRIYEWLKASPVEGKEGQGFELICMGVNLLGKLDQSIGEAGLRNATVMVEFSEADE